VAPKKKPAEKPKAPEEKPLVASTPSMPTLQKSEEESKDAQKKKNKKKKKTKQAEEEVDTLKQSIMAS